MIATCTCIYAYLFYQYWWAYSADRKLFGNWDKVVFKEINVFKINYQNGNNYANIMLFKRDILYKVVV